MPFREHLNTLNVALIYLIVVTGLSLRSKTGPGIAASVAAFVCFDFFFIPPVHTFTVARTDHVLALFVFLGIAILTSQLVVRVRAQTAEALRRGQQMAILYDLSSALIGEIALPELLKTIAARVYRIFSLDVCAILLAENDRLKPQAVVGEEFFDLADRNLVALGRWTMEKRKATGLELTRAKIRPPGPAGQSPRWNFAQGRRDRDILLFPIATKRRALGVFVVARRRGRPGFRSEEIQLLEIFANQAALAIEQSVLIREQTRAEILSRSDELKSALLSAVSHDLRTPLASIKASATTLLQRDVEWPEEDRRELLEAIDEETDRLNQLVANLLDLSRIESGALRPEFDWYNLDEVIQEAVDRAAPLLGQHSLELAIENDLPLMRLDYVEIVQVLINLLQNAAKYSPDGTGIWLSAAQVGQVVEVAVRDEGIGIPAGEEERIFDKFYRVESPHRTIGSGIGLAICKGFVEAHGGRIWAERNPERGTTFWFTLPVVRLDALDPVAELRGDRS